MSDFETVPVGTMCKLKAVEEEREALAALVQDWRVGIALAKAWHWERDERGYAGSKKEADAFLDWLADRDQNDSPSTSLARLKAEWQAKALERYSRIITEEWIDKGENYGLRTASGQALLQAAEIRRQAEESQ